MSAWALSHPPSAVHTLSPFSYISMIAAHQLKHVGLVTLEY